MSSTWGQLRLLLKQANAAVSLDLIDGYLNKRYEQVLAANDWQDAKTHTTLQTTAAYQSGTDTATFTVGSATVTGSGTSWQASQSGLKIYRPGDTVTYKVTYNSATSFSLDRPYEGLDGDAPGTVYAAAAYVLMQNVYQLPANCGGIISILDPITQLPLGELSKIEFDQSVGPRTLVANPEVWAPYDVTPEGAPPVLKQVELYPPPLYARGLPLYYRFGALGFDGVSTNLSPLPWVTDAVLLEGASADLALYQAKTAENPSSYLAAAKAHEALFQIALAELLRKEHMQVRKKTPLKMANRFTRHRLARVNRGMSNFWGPGAGGPQ